MLVLAGVVVVMVVIAVSPLIGPVLASANQRAYLDRLKSVVLDNAVIGLLILLALAALALIVEAVRAPVQLNRERRLIQLGHSSVSITLDTYSHVFGTMRRAAADAMDRAVGRQT